MASKLEHYASLASEAVKEKLKELRSKISEDSIDTPEENDVEMEEIQDKQTSLRTKLSSSLQCKPIDTEALESTICKTEMPKSIAMQPGFEKLEHLSSKTSRRQEKKQKKEEQSKTKGKKWFDMPATEQTEENMNELKIIQMRGIINANRFYKRTENRPGVLPKFFQLGTVVESPADFYSSRVPKKHRKKSLVDELLADVEFQKFRKRKYAEVASKSQGQKKFFKKKKK